MVHLQPVIKNKFLSDQFWSSDQITQVLINKTNIIYQYWNLHNTEIHEISNISTPICYGPHLTVRPLTSKTNLPWTTFDCASPDIHFPLWKTKQIYYIHLQIHNKYHNNREIHCFSTHIACNMFSPLAHNANLMSTSHFHIFSTQVQLIAEIFHCFQQTIE